MKEKELIPNLIGTSGDSLRESFGKALVNLAEDYPNFVVLDADVAGGTGTHHFRKSNTNRFFQFGIAEQNMMAAAAGMATVGLIPIVTTFAVFCIRAIEQARLSIAYSGKNVKIVASHPGLDVGPDGGSAQSLEDLSYFRNIPGMVVISPADSLEITQATEEILKYVGPVYMRTGRSASKKCLPDSYQFKIGKGVILKDGIDLTIIACGVQVSRALEAAKILENKGLNARVVNMSTIKPIDKDLIIKCAKETKFIITTEDHNIIGGLGSAVSEVLSQNFPTPMAFNGIQDVFGESGEPDELVEKFEISPSSIVASAINLINKFK